MPKKLNKESFSQKAITVHGNKYDYSKVKYTSSQLKIIIICKEHGEFEQASFSHLLGVGCPFCSGNKNTLSFEKRASLVHNNKYDYSNVKYVNNKIKVEIICPIHGSFFQSPNSHLLKKGCTKCGFSFISKKLTSTKDKFIEKANITHDNKYDYSKVNYINSKTAITIVCEKHGEFKQKPSEHIRGRGCIKCKASSGETKIMKLLKKNGISFIHQKRFSGCKFKRPLPFDFYIPSINTCIEFDGIQHYNKKSIYWTEEINERDNVKNKYCKENNLTLIRIPYWTKNEDIDKVIKTLTKKE